MANEYSLAGQFGLLPFAHSFVAELMGTEKDT
jgi:hypothetical protein